MHSSRRVLSSTYARSFIVFVIATNVVTQHLSIFALEPEFAETIVRGKETRGPMQYKYRSLSMTGSVIRDVRLVSPSLFEGSKGLRIKCHDIS